MLPPPGDCDDCIPAYSQRNLQSHSLLAIFFSSIPFVATFLVVATVVLHKLFPLLAAQAEIQSGYENKAQSSGLELRLPLSQSSGRRKLSLRGVAAFSFSCTIALAAVLTELILCEISNTLNPAVRALALRVTVSLLLCFLIIAIPLLEIYALISAAGWTFTGSGKRLLRFAWVLEAVAFTSWLIGFWWIGQGLPGMHVQGKLENVSYSLSEACLERIGVIGISLMALLSGFASVSSPWQTFGSKSRLVTEADISRKHAGLEATSDMLSAKQSRLRALERKISDAPQEGFMNKMIGSIRGNADIQERKALQLEISGLETMRTSLSSSLSLLQQRRQAQQRSTTMAGRLLNMSSYIFSLYCVYRIFATLIATLRRWWYSDATFSGTDPINNFLAIIAKHWDPTLDRLAWSQQISFLLSGVILLASFNSVLQTFHLFSRYTPALLYHTQANLALLVSQVSATYVISSALLLRSNLPHEVGSVISEALGAPLDPKFVDRWFEGWFLAASALTAVCILIGRKVSGGVDWDDDDDGDVEMGKRS
ncbi:MAG: hypothetical protein M1835_000409 [Candelina submexicana]|nr:MAG: hypothetical protein M1835_000409 [Candelina submexicana]